MQNSTFPTRSAQFCQAYREQDVLFALHYTSSTSLFPAIDASLPVGAIPRELGNLTALTYLSLSYNQLTGMYNRISNLFPSYSTWQEYF